MDPLIKISESERKAWKRQREKRELTTRQLGDLVGVTHSTISNYETGIQRQIHRSKYIALMRALFRLPAEEAEQRADESHERSSAIFRRIAQLSVEVDDDELEDWARYLESRQRRARAKEP